MQLKFTACLILLTCLASSLSGKPLCRKGFFGNEEDVWEELTYDHTPRNIGMISSKSIHNPPKAILKPITYDLTTAAPTANDTPSVDSEKDNSKPTAAAIESIYNPHAVARGKTGSRILPTYFSRAGLNNLDDSVESLIREIIGNNLF